MELFTLLNKLGKIDRMFFLTCLIIIVLIVAVYFLIPVFNKGQYEEQRNNLKLREKSFKANINANKKEDNK